MAPGEGDKTGRRTTCEAKAGLDNNCPVLTILHSNQKTGTIRSTTGCAMRMVSGHSGKRNRDN